MADNNDSVAGLAGIAGQLASTGLQMSFNAAESRKGREFGREMYARQRADALADISDARQYYQQMLADERAYNSSASQVARLKAAGLNPALAYGGQITTAAPSGGFSSATPQPAHVPSSPIAQVSMPDLSGGFQSIFSSMTNKRVADSNIRNQDLITRADVILKAAQSRVLDSQNAGQMLQNLFMQSTLDERIELVTLEIENAYSSIVNLDLQNASLQNEIDAFPIRMEKVKAEIENIVANTSLTEAQRSESIARTVKAYKESELVAVQTLKTKFEGDIASQHLSQEKYKTEMQKVTYWVDTVTDGIDSVADLVNSVTGGIGKVAGAIFGRKNAETYRQNSENNRKRWQSAPSSSRYNARKRRSNPF